MLNTHFVLTLLVLLAAIGMIARTVVIERRPRTNLNPRLIPTTPVLIGCALIAILALVHLAGMAGIHSSKFH
jgi:hypothetical protein